MEANQKTDTLILLANVLLALSAIPTILLALETRRGSPEGPVGFHMVTAPLALLQVIALAIAIHRGVFDFLPAGRPLAYGMLIPYFIGMTILPVFGLERSIIGPLSKIAMVAIVLACFASVNRLPGLVLSACVLSIGSLAGLTLIGSGFAQSIQNSIRAATAGRESMTAFEKSQSRFQADEWAKLPENPALWQLIQFTHPFDPELKRKCLEKIAALPELEQKTIDLLGTGWAEHSLAYLDDHYPLRYAALAPAYAKFLDQQLEHWTPHLYSNPHAATWGNNLIRHFNVAEKIVKEGGDLKAPLQGWLKLFSEAKGMGEFQRRVQAMLR
ncbi:MAG: hypothetical protein JNL62_16805 [Bryobacterales bacterium]|nr:hypothetical protein [Bryobacterales bacterium]